MPDQPVYWEATYFAGGMHPNKIQFHTEDEALVWWEKNKGNPYTGVTTLNRIETLRNNR